MRMEKKRGSNSANSKIIDSDFRCYVLDNHWIISAI